MKKMLLTNAFRRTDGRGNLDSYKTESQTQYFNETLYGSRMRFQKP